MKGEDRASGVLLPPTNNTCPQKVKARIKKHWTVPQKHRTPEQDEAEDYLISFYIGKSRYWFVRGIKFSRWYLFFAAFLIQFCIGSLYSWSVLNKPLDTLLYHNAKAEKSVNAFYTAVGIFGTTTAIMGPWIERNGPRAGVLLGASAFFIGYVIVAISLHSKWATGLYLGYGVVSAFGMGLCYISPVSALQKWFPDYRGTAAGFAVGGYGAGSIVWGKAYLPIIDLVGLPSLFLVVGGIMLCVLFCCAIVLRSPHHEFTAGGLNIHGEAVGEAEEASRRGEKFSVMSSHEYESIVTPSAHDLEEAVHPTTTAQAMVKKLTLIDAIKTIDFKFLYLMFFANQLFGLIVLSKVSSMCVDLFGKTAAQGADIVSVNGAFNSIGRVMFPVISDAIIKYFKVEPAKGRKMIFWYALVVQMIIVGTLPYLIRHKNFTMFCIETFILTASYGGGFGTIPCFLTDMFGAYNIGAMHGIILTSWSIGGVGGGMSFNSAYRSAIADGTSPADAYISAFHKIFAILVVGFFLNFFVRTNPLDRFAPGYRYSICGKTVLHIKSKKQNEDPNALLLNDA
uniref:Major facilitator superfamily (MFS) profile domain-containing protein n=1 Tax=Globisporangium ultimum (strain ATCC 200006 / CBS 805.95 / DAOM BR144) TaxID=431595 RepID=K3WVV4_GLOUD